MTTREKIKNPRNRNRKHRAKRLAISVTTIGCGRAVFPLSLQCFCIRVIRLRFDENVSIKCWNRVKNSLNHPNPIPLAQRMEMNTRRLLKTQTHTRPRLVVILVWKQANERLCMKKEMDFPFIITVISITVRQSEFTVICKRGKNER